MSRFAKWRQYAVTFSSAFVQLGRRVSGENGFFGHRTQDFRLRLHALRDLLARYHQHVVHFWSKRHEVTPPDLKAHESEFLPSALSLQSAPVSPAGRWVARILIALLAGLLLWSVIGRMDIIVNASGKIIPSDRSKTIASVETARVDRLYVEEGQSVNAGDLLIELDTRMSDRERDKATGDRETALLQVARSRALLASIDSHRLVPMVGVEGLPGQRLADARRHLESQWEDFETKLTRLDGEIARYSRQLPLIAQRANDYRVLAQDHDVSVHAWLEKEQERVEMEGKLADVTNQSRAHIAETRKIAQDALNEGLRQSQSSGQDAERAVAHSDLLRLKAPVAGTVQQLTVHTVGGVVQSAQPLMVIVPRQHQVEVEAFIENKDVGFVVEGQHAQVKIETFDYTKYGTVSGRVSQVSRDAIDPNAHSGGPVSPQDHEGSTKKDSPKGPLYAVKVLLDKSSMNIDGRQVALTPGMSVSIEIKTGSRRIIEYFLSPLIQHAHESFNQR
ncbi:MAG TPA: HlyD family type I secretion periplasmic adaptor subunit [Chlorobaculum sp.]|nr:HlyD family type I secretion periplasmic adaptor subunit [Chlorobaculum sp.]